MTQVLYQLQFKNSRNINWRKHKKYPSTESQDFANSEMDRIVQNKVAVSMPGGEVATDIRVLELTVEHKELRRGKIAI